MAYMLSELDAQWRVDWSLDWRDDRADDGISAGKPVARI
jgi:hypothetical protein